MPIATNFPTSGADRASGRPIHNAIVWQDRRTDEICAALREKGHEPMILGRSSRMHQQSCQRVSLSERAAHLPKPARVRTERCELGGKIPRDASALTHSEDTGRRLSLEKMVSAGLIQTNGFEDRLCSRM